MLKNINFLTRDQIFSMCCFSKYTYCILIGNMLYAVCQTASM